MAYGGNATEFFLVFDHEITFIEIRRSPPEPFLPLERAIFPFGNVDWLMG